MSIQSVSSQVASVDREIHSIENQIHTLESNISRKQHDANGILDKISREKDLKRVIGLNKDLSRKQDEITRLDRDRSNKTKSLADKRKKRNDLQGQLNKLEQKERDLAKKEQKEILSLQQEITREMERQNFRSLQATNFLTPMQESKKYDVFVSHASEDKEDFVREFANCLRSKGLIVWYDEFELSIGDSLRRKIDAGLGNSKYGIIVLSVNFFNKEWPQKELDGLFSKDEGSILPIWHKISKDEVKKYSPMIAGLLALNTTSFTIEEIADKIATKIKGGKNETPS